MAKHSVVEIDFGKLGRNLAGLLQCFAAQEDAYGNQDETADEEGRQEEEEDDAEVRVVIGAAEHLDQPIADHGDAGSAGNGAARETDGIIAEEQRGPYPAVAKFLKQTHIAPQKEMKLSSERAKLRWECTARA